MALPLAVGDTLPEVLGVNLAVFVPLLVIVLLAEFVPV